MTTTRELNGKRSELLSLLRRETNGAVAASMQEKGLRYPLNYGVSIADIKRISAGFAPDHSLARHIYTSEIRELRLAALLIADRRAVTPDQTEFWGEGITTTEMASGGAVWLFSKTPAAAAIIFSFFGSGTPLLRYCSLMTAAANVFHTGGNPQWSLSEFISLIGRDLAANPEEWDGFLRSGLGALCLRLWELVPECRPAINELIAHSTLDLASYLRTEIGL